jgi:hypothetical protein
VNEYIQKYFDSTKSDSYINDERQRYGLMYYKDDGQLYFGDGLEINGTVKVFITILNFQHMMVIF